MTAVGPMSYPGVPKRRLPRVSKVSRDWPVDVGVV